MDTLRQLARLPSDRFTQDKPENKRLQCISIRNYGSPTRTQALTSVDELAQRIFLTLEPLETEADVSAALTLVKIPRHDNEVIGLSASLFSGIFDACRLDPRFLHLLRNNRYGLHYESCQRRHCYYIGTVLYTLMWAFNPRTRVTRAVLLLRDSSNVRSFAEFRRILEMESSRLHTPFVLSWVALVQLSNWVDLVTYSQLTTVRKLENTTGHGPYGGSRGSTLKLTHQHETVDELARASKEVGSVLADLANQVRHVAISLDIAGHIMSATKLENIESYTTSQYKSVFIEELETFTGGIPSIRRSLTDSREYILYIQERSRNQASVITSLLSSEDAWVSIKLAQASRELAEASEKNSSAMKTIAVMTMLFLPGTFFAALWAVPSLTWNEPKVVQDNFWVYWVFTVPTTIVTFAVWFYIHHRQYRPALAPLASPSASPPSPLSPWSLKKKPNNNGKLNSIWPASHNYLPLAVGGTNLASISMQHLHNDLPAPRSDSSHEEI